MERGTISALENRDSNRSERFQSIAKAFGLTLEQLCDETTDYKPNPASLAYPAQVPSAPLLLKDNTSNSAKWPFSDRIKPWQYNQLDDAEKHEVENFIMFNCRSGNPRRNTYRPRTTSAQAHKIASNSINVYCFLTYKTKRDSRARSLGI